MIDSSVKGSPGWWAAKLMPRLVENRGRYNLLEDYYRGRSPLPSGPDNCSDTWRRFQAKARANWAELIVEAVQERMTPVGFRTGAQGDDLGDSEAWGIWQANSLDADATLLHRYQLMMGDEYAIVGPPSASTHGEPLITIEDPREVITAHDPQERRRVRSALKVWTDTDAGLENAVVYLPEGVFRAARKASEYGLTEDTLSGWEWVGRDDNPLGVVPVVRFTNRANLSGHGTGEFEPVLDSIDRINLMLLQRLTIAVMQAFRQRAAKGLPLTDGSGQRIDWSSALSAGPGEIWALPPGVEMWESGGVDLTPILESVKADIRDLAATTRTPMFYLFPDAANGSAEGATLQREGLVFKTNDRIRQTSDPWEQVMYLAFAYKGDEERASRRDMEVLWAPPERFSLSERYDAASKASAAGVPWRTVMLDILQFSPQQVDRMEAERATDLLLSPLPEPVPAL